MLSIKQEEEKEEIIIKSEEDVDKFGVSPIK